MLLNWWCVPASSHPLCRWLPQVLNLAVPFPHFWLWQLSHQWEGFLGEKEGVLQWRALQQEGPQASGREEVTLSVLSPHLTLTDGLMQWLHLQPFKSTVSSVFMWNDHRCVWPEAPTEGVCFPFHGTVVGLKGSDRLCRTFPLMSRRNPPWISLPFKKFHVSLSFLLLPRVLKMASALQNTFSLTSFQQNFCPLRLTQTACSNVILQSLL